MEPAALLGQSGNVRSPKLGSAMFFRGRQGRREGGKGKGVPTTHALRIDQEK